MATKYGKWVVIKSLAEGGQAHTFLVSSEDDAPGTVHVLKRLKNKNRIERFVSEIETVRKIENPFVVRIVDFDANGEKPYLVMPHYTKGTLENVPLADLSVLDKLELFRKICRGVRCAHSNGVVHRDLKPENIFIAENGDPIVGDFGICHVVDGERFTLTDEAVGPFRYMAPELEDGAVDSVMPSADVYSLGKLLYWLLTGKTFAREKHREKHFDLTRQNNEPIYPLIYEFLDDMIVADPSARISDANEVFKKLEDLIARIKMNARAIGPNIPQLCTFCGKGYYQLVVNDHGSNSSGSSSADNFGFTLRGNPIFRILVCDFCSHTQIFRPDYLERPNPWVKKVVP